MSVRNLNIQYTVSSQVQLYAKTGKGFHSNDTRVVVANDGHQILPAAYGSDLGFIVKPTKNIILEYSSLLSLSAAGVCLCRR
ncbi:MAG: hypothetical protein WKG06_36660 [Segetibacter sp.]